MRFTTAAELLMMLIEAKRNGKERKFRSFDRVQLLLIDELGYIPFEREATDLLFNVVSARYERASIALTTNLPLKSGCKYFPARWLLPQSSIASSIVVRSSQSYRLRQHKAKSGNAMTVSETSAALGQPVIAEKRGQILGTVSMRERPEQARRPSGSVLTRLNRVSLIPAATRCRPGPSGSARGA